MSKSGDGTLQLGFGLRVSMVETDDGTPGSGVDYVTGSPGIGSTLGECMELSAVVNAFHYGHQCKTQIEYTLHETTRTPPPARA